jgi:hypothetical protein
MMLPPLPFQFEPVPVLEALDASQRQGLQARPEPVLVRGLAAELPLEGVLASAPDDAARAHLLSGLFGAREVRVTSVPSTQGGVLGYRDDSLERNFAETAMTFAQLVPPLLAGARGEGPALYVQAHSVRGFAALENLAQAPFLPRARESESNFWVGSGGHVVNLHFDQYENYICMLAGTKRVTLFPPQVLPDIYMGPLDKGPAGAPGSLVKLLAVDPLKYPRFERVLPHGRVAVLHPGDVLRIPPLWWHHVESFGLNVMVNTWVYEIPYRRLQAALTLLLQGIVLFQPLSPEERERLTPVVRLAWSDLRTPVFQLGARAGEPTSTLARHLRHLASVVRRLPPTWRRDLSTFYDHLVLQRNGDPLPTLPGEHARMAARLGLLLG